MIKNTFVIISLLLLPAFAISSNKKTETIVIKTTIYCDHCLQCESCGDRIKKELPYIKGVTFAKFDDMAMTFTITFNTGKTTPEKIRQAIANIGYDADDIKANPKALEKFDACCLKK